MTHILRLKNIEEPLANFFASGLLCLKEKLGPILWQFPPNVTLKDDRFENFIKLLPHKSSQARELARQHGEKMEGRAYTEAKGIPLIRHAFEFRHKSFLNKDFLSLLKENNIAFVFAHEGGENSPYIEEPTSNFVYARLHGEGKKYSKGYPAREIAQWVKRIEGWAKSNLDSFIYFSNEAKVYSPTGAIKLLKSFSLS